MLNFRAIFLILISCLTISFQARAVSSDSMREMQIKVDQFHLQITNGKYDEIYESLNDSFKNSIGKNEFIDYMKDARSKFGSFKETKILNRISKKAIFGKGRPTVFLTYKSNYSNYLVEELFIFEEYKSQFGFAGYKYTIFENIEK